MKVHEIMTAHARGVSPENTLVEAAGLMRELDVGALPVCEGDRVTGMITDRDITVRAVANGRDPNATPVSEVMTPDATTVFADQEVEQAARLMQQREVRRLPVLGRENRLVGIVSLGDIAMSSNPAFSGTTLREVSEPHNPNGRQRKRAALGAAAGAGTPPERRSYDEDTRGEENDRAQTRDESEAAEGQERKAAAGGRMRERGGAGAGASSRTRGEGRQQRQRKSSATRKRGAGSSKRGGGKRGAGSRGRKTGARAR